MPSGLRWMPGRVVDRDEVATQVPATESADEGHQRTVAGAECCLGRQEARRQIVRSATDSGDMCAAVCLTDRA